jgi:diaminohydroxyphosphoribosylaminopyrimidine deaminase/5-amino-6-(5-phosphoribosylamino)uracil reductase
MPRGVDAAHLPVALHAGRFDLAAVLTLLAARDINEVQVEAGATLAGAFLAAGLVDELLLYVAPVILGEHARPMFEGLPIDTMAERLAMTIAETRRIGEDVRLLLRPKSSLP